ncbi:MiaB/RimO family radical SAM methylthiotransferase [Desulfonatronum sp. SC1]|uniref:MiaB/RimO family radical SAM methylthiotransferase n=1 Tax=Desulfonatronum sp. SC1 TaxID=2109626 RepID=UPI000D302F9B|nr:MiaB/RimO family radical SAM methylthiotransferase [Desulfonatronum sp. SC1]PTN39020.1 tRNA (N6-isopentenyl adenosine(37)-C2)-methylthiotransferase MiaB [Desulfonatronum sp. SC1]
MRFHLTTFGCKVNQYESQVILEHWVGQGHVPVDEAAQAEVILIHSCAVTAKAVAELRKAATALRRTAPGAGIMITGCAAQTFGAELRGLSGVIGVFGTRDRGRLLGGPDVLVEQSVDALLPGSTAGGDMLAGVSDFRRARAQVKVQDGCSHGCTYCIVPLARGPGHSREPGEVIEEVRRLLAAGFREISLIGVNLRLYGRDLEPRCDFWDLVQTLELTFAPDWSRRARLRLSSLDPAMLGTKALDVISGSRLLCPHLHLSLQSASPAVLKAMGRSHYQPETILEFCDRLERRLGLYGLGADLLTGFPGEEDAHFRETLEFCAALPLTYAHVFPFSPRPGTPAADRADQVPEEVRRERARQLRAQTGIKHRAFLRALAERRDTVTMVVEGTAPYRGKCEYYVPCRLIRQPEGSKGKTNKDAARKDGETTFGTMHALPRTRELIRVRPLGAVLKGRDWGLECVPTDEPSDRESGNEN